MLLAGENTNEYEYTLNEYSVTVFIQSTITEVIRRTISAKINSATQFLERVGSKTRGNSWFTWRVDNANEMKRLDTVMSTSDNRTPSGLLNAGASRAM